MSSRSTRDSTKRKSEASVAQASTTSNNGQKRAKKESATKPKSNIDDMAQPKGALQVNEETGDIFDAPPNTLIIHACNCQGSWGAGIAKAFHDRYPKAYAEYAEVCEKDGNDLLDSALLIPPVDHGYTGSAGTYTATDVPKHFVGCLFTSRFYGKKRDTPSRILAATKPAMENLLNQVNAWNEESGDDDKVGEVRICKINSGLFGVPWDSTKPLLEKMDVSQHDVKKVKVVSPPG